MASIATIVKLKLPGGGNSVGPVSLQFKGQASSLHAHMVQGWERNIEQRLTLAERKSRFIEDMWSGLEGIGGEYWDYLMKKSKKEMNEFKKEWIENYMEEMGLEYVPGKKPLVRKKR